MIDGLISLVVSLASFFWNDIIVFLAVWFVTLIRENVILQWLIAIFISFLTFFAVRYMYVNREKVYEVNSRL
jgi:hypothetical protein